MKRKKQRSDAEDRRNLKRRVLRSIEDREWDEVSKHLNDELSELPEDDGASEDSDDDWLS